MELWRKPNLDIAVTGRSELDPKIVIRARAYLAKISSVALL